MEKGFNIKRTDSGRRWSGNETELRQPQSLPVINDPPFESPVAKIALRSYTEAVTPEEKAFVSSLFMQETLFSGKSILVTWLLCLNAVVGSGVLGIPYAFRKAGLGLSIMFLGLITALAMATANYLMETQCRMQALVNLTLRRRRQEEMIQQPSKLPSPEISKQQAIHDTQQEVALLKLEAKELKVPGYGPKALSLPPLPDDFQIQSESRVFEVNEMCELFLGDRGKRAWEISILLEVYACLWLYCAMMGSTVLNVVPIPGLTDGHCEVRGVMSPGCETAYGIWLVLIALVLVPITLRDLSDVGVVQIALTYLGYCLMGVMLLTVVWALFTIPCPGVETRQSPPYIASQNAVLFSGFGLLFSTTVFTQICHIAIPSLTQVMKEKKRGIRIVVLGGMATTYVLYSVLGVVTNLYFGDTVAPIITLNFQGFAWSGSLGPFTRLVDTMVVMLPFVTIANAFPVNAHALANNVITSLRPETWRALLLMGSEGQSLLSSGPPRRVKLAARLICTLPPFLLAFLQRDPSRIVTLIGVFGFALMFFLPCALQIKSVALFQQVWPHAKGIHRTHHSNVFSEIPAVLLVLALSSVGFVVNFNNVLHSLLA